MSAPEKIFLASKLYSTTPSNALTKINNKGIKMEHYKFSLLHYKKSRRYISPKKYNIYYVYNYIYPIGP